MGSGTKAAFSLARHAGPPVCGGLDALHARLLQELTTGPTVAPRPAAAASLLPLPVPRRSRLSDLNPSLHCSVVGTCFELGELRRLLAKLGRDVAHATEHELHHEAVTIASQSDDAGRLMSKALDRKYKTTISRFAGLEDEAAVAHAWEEALARGDIPAAYWATLTHPATGPDLIRRAFGEVHMLSHLVGATNRADIRQVRDLTRERDELKDALARQRRQFGETLAAKDARLRELERLLAERPVADEGMPADVAALEAALGRERARNDKLAHHLAVLEARLQTTPDWALPAPPSSVPDDAAHAAHPAHVAATKPARPAMPALDGGTVLLVGGRAAQVPALARAVAAAAGRLLHHDGGVEMNLGLLAGLAGRADRIVLALDSVSHAAADAVRRLAREGSKPLLLLPGLSQASLARALGGDAGP